MKVFSYLTLCIGIMVVIGVCTVTRTCRTNYVEFMNAQHIDTKVTLELKSSFSANVPAIEDTLDSSAPYTGLIASDLSEMVYAVKAENLETGETVEGIYGGYVVPNDGHMHIFLIDDNGIHHNSWNMFSNNVIGTILYGLHIFANKMSCLDNKLWQ